MSRIFEILVTVATNELDKIKKCYICEQATSTTNNQLLSFKNCEHYYHLPCHMNFKTALDVACLMNSSTLHPMTADINKISSCTFCQSHSHLTSNCITWAYYGLWMSTDIVYCL